MTPDERAGAVAAGFRDSLDGLDPEFRARVEAKSRRLAEERGLLTTASSSRDARHRSDVDVVEHRDDFVD